MNPTTLATLLATALAAGGCAMSATPNYDSAFGESVRQARAMQLVNPDAGRNTDSVAGIDARAARTSVERYYDSFRAPPATFEVLNIGGSALSSGN